MLADQFTEIFREEHRQVRDALLDLIGAFKRRDREVISQLLERTAKLTGPHFRYEEELLYPALVQIFGEKYVDYLFSEHDRAIGRAGKLVELAAKPTLSDADIKQAEELIRAILPHVSDCDGLSIMVERLPEQTVQEVLETRERSNRAGLDLMQWTQQVRKRPMQAAA